MSEELVTRPNTVVGVFGQRDDLERALEQLRNSGFREEQVGVTMRGLHLGEADSPADGEVVREGAESVLIVRVEGRHDEAEQILRACGAEEIHWTNSLTASMAGSAGEIVDSET